MEDKIRIEKDFRLGGTHFNLTENPSILIKSQLQTIYLLETNQSYCEEAHTLATENNTAILSIGGNANWPPPGIGF